VRLRVQVLRGPPLKNSNFLVDIIEIQVDFIKTECRERLISVLEVEAQIFLRPPYNDYFYKHETKDILIRLNYF